MCDVPSIAVFCSETIECFPGTASKFFLKFLVTIPVAPIITGIIVHYYYYYYYYYYCGGGGGGGGGGCSGGGGGGGGQNIAHSEPNPYISRWRPLRLTQLYSGTEHCAPEDLLVLLQLLREK
jgi:hypothetical protein